MKNFMVYDIGGSAIKWSIISIDGNIIKSDKLKIAKDIDAFFYSLETNTNKYKEEYNLQGIAISAPGAVDNKTGIIRGSSAIPYIHGPNIKEILSKRTGLKVNMENDANCSALGECWLGSSKDAVDSAFVVCGTGIGGAIVKNKKIHLGSNKHGGEFGYCIVESDIKNDKYYTWSNVGSTYAVASSIAEKKGISKEGFDGLKAFELYDNGDEVAIKEINIFFKYMAIGIYNIQYTYDPEVIVIGGAICERPGFIEEIHSRIELIIDSNKHATIKPVIRKCKYGNDSNKLGALYSYLQEENLI